MEYCRQYKGLKLYAFCLMSNHIHLVCGARALIVEQAEDYLFSSARSYSSLVGMIEVDHEF